MKHRNFAGNLDTIDPIELLDLYTGDIRSAGDRSQIEQALKIAIDAQDSNDLRPSSLDIAYTLKQLGADHETLTAALLSDPRLRDTLDTLTIEQRFNATIANIVKHVHWLNTLNNDRKSIGYLPEQLEELRKMLLATVDDVRAVLIRLAFRLQRLRNLSREPSEIQPSIARETLDIFSPLANRLGIGELKWELEDLAFKYLDFDRYISLAKSMSVNRSERETYLQNFIDQLHNLLEYQNIKSRVYGRPKHLYSILKKMQRKQQECHELADLLAVRVVVEDIPQCYLVLGIVHGLWKHLPHEFDDYIASPKENGYQSIHTAIFGPDKQIIEIQIRTHDMHEFAEHGVAAHWRYKEGSSQDRAMEKTIEALRRLLENPSDDDLLLDEFKTDFFSDRVLVMTPSGEIINLPNQSTALDFAYTIHTEVGHRCTGAKVNGHRVPLSYPLKSGERVEILTDPESTPHLDWLNQRKLFVTTNRARIKIRNWFRDQYRDTDSAQLISAANVSGMGSHRLISATCCHPRIGDRIIGVYQDDSSIVVHRHDCPKANLDRKRLLELKWGEATKKSTITLHIDAFDRLGLLQDITTLLNQSHTNVLRANTVTDTTDQSVSMDLTIELNQDDKLSLLIKRIENLPNVFRATQL